MNRAFIALVALLVWVLAASGCSSSSDSPTGSSSAGSSSAAGSSAGGSDSSAAGAPASSTDATLSDLVPSVGAFVPVFASQRMSCTLRVPNGTTSIVLTATATSPGASIQVNGAPVASGQPSAAQPLAADGSAVDIPIVVTAEDGAASATYTVHVVQQPLASHVTVYSVGDSTMANYEPTVNPKQRGWMQMFPEFVTGDLAVSNNGINGTSSKSYYLSGAWDTVKFKLSAGDYVLIQFGHNDEKDAGLEGPGGVGTTAWGSYHDYLSKYVSEARALGAIPVLVTPVVRLGWAGASLKPVACHDLTGNGTAVGDANYPAAMRDVAATLNCPLVDLTLASKALVEQYGPSDAKSILYVSTDDTHLQIMGATVYAQLAVEGLLALDVLSDQLSPAFGLKLNPAALDFGVRYLGTSLDSAFSVLGLSLVPDAGTVALHAPSGFLVGTDREHLGATLELPYTRGALPPTTVQVRFQPLLAQTYAAPLSLGIGADTLASVALTGAGLDVPAGGTEVEARYALDSAASGVACVATGGVSCADEALVGLYVQDYQPLTTLLPIPTPLPTQRLSILSTPAADSWPPETDVNPQRYVEFAVNVGAAQTLSIDTVSLYAGAVGGPNLAFRVQSSTEADFSAPTELLASLTNPTNTLTFHSFSPLASVAAGKGFRLRVYPYSKTIATKKYLSLQSVTVHGVAW